MYINDLVFSFEIFKVNNSLWVFSLKVSFDLNFRCFSYISKMNLVLLIILIFLPSTLIIFLQVNQNYHLVEFKKLSKFLKLMNISQPFWLIFNLISKSIDLQFPFFENFSQLINWFLKVSSYLLNSSYTYNQRWIYKTISQFYNLLIRSLYFYF